MTDSLQKYAATKPPGKRQLVTVKHLKSGSASEGDSVYLVDLERHYMGFYKIGHIIQTYII